MSVAFSLSERCLLRPRISFVPRRCWGWWKLQFYQHQRCEKRNQQGKEVDGAARGSRLFHKWIVLRQYSATSMLIWWMGWVVTAVLLALLMLFERSAFSFSSYNTQLMVWCLILIGHLPTVDRDRTILAELLFCFMYLANEVDETLSWFWHSLFRPVCELKLPYCPWLSILGTRDEERE